MQCEHAFEIGRFMILTIVCRLARWLRYAGSAEPKIDHFTDDVERALAGERPNSPYHRHRGQFAEAVRQRDS